VPHFRGFDEETITMKISTKGGLATPLGIASKQTRGADGLFTDDVLKSRITGLATE
jgi:hypothetical protein